MRNLKIRTKVRGFKFPKLKKELAIRKVESGATFYIFQWKQPQNSTHEYEITVNGKKIIKKTEANTILFSCYKSNFNEGENTVQVAAQTSNDCSVTESLKFNYSYSD